MTSNKGKGYYSIGTNQLLRIIKAISHDTEDGTPIYWNLKYVNKNEEGYYRHNNNSAIVISKGERRITLTGFLHIITVFTLDNIKCSYKQLRKRIRIKTRNNGKASITLTINDDNRLRKILDLPLIKAQDLNTLIEKL